MDIRPASQIASDVLDVGRWRCIRKAFPNLTDDQVLALVLDLLKRSAS